MTSWTFLGAALALAIVPSGTLAAEVMNGEAKAGSVMADAGTETATAPTAGQAAFRDIYREMVETDTSSVSGSCTLLAQRIAARFRKAGFAENQITFFVDMAFPLDGGLVVKVPGTSAKAKPVLLMGQLDVVNAWAIHWKTDPYKLVEKDGYFYGRGAYDQKALAAVWVDTLLRLRTEGFKPKRPITLAMTCGEEAGSRFNGARWLTEHRPDLVAAEFALNEGGGGETDGHGKVINQSIAVGEKEMVSFDLEAMSEGGHSAIPCHDNAIYSLAEAVLKVRALKFPLRFNDTTRTYFAKIGAARGDAIGAAMVRLAADPSDSAAEAVVSTDRIYNAMLHTTCVTTLIQGGYVISALPQTAKASINCRIIPGEDAEGTRTALYNAIGNPDMVLTRLGGVQPRAVQPPLDPRVIAPAEKLVAQYFPGVPLVPSMMAYMSDARYLGLLNIPVYGVPGLYTDPDGSNMHGHNERMAVASVMTAREFLHDLVKVYAAQE